MQEIKIPELAESITEGTIAEWLVKEGDKVEKGDAIVELETDKVNVEVNSEFTGVITEIISTEGEDVSVGDIIGKLDENGEAGASSGNEESKKEEEAPKEEPKKEPAVENKQETASEQNNGNVIASPAARKRARELGIDLSEVQTRDPLAEFARMM